MLHGSFLRWLRELGFICSIHVLRAVVDIVRLSFVQIDVIIRETT